MTQTNTPPENDKDSNKIEIEFSGNVGTGCFSACLYFILAIFLLRCVVETTCSVLGIKADDDLVSRIVRGIMLLVLAILGILLGIGFLRKSRKK